MKTSLRTSLGALALAGLLAACSDDTTTNKQTQTAPASSPAAESPAPAADNKLETRFATIATGGASGPYNIIATTMGEIFNKTYGVNSKPRPQVLRLRTST